MPLQAEHTSQQLLHLHPDESLEGRAEAAAPSSRPGPSSRLTVPVLSALGPVSVYPSDIKASNGASNSVQHGRSGNPRAQRWVLDGVSVDRLGTLRL